MYTWRTITFMSKLFKNKEMVSKHKIISCSTPERQGESPSRDSDSEAASPVPFLCTQDGAEGETDVVWNFYTPTSKNAALKRKNDTTPVSRKSKRSLRQKLIERPPPKRRGVKPSQKNTALLQELLELKQNLPSLIPKTANNVIEDKNSGSEDDIFNDCTLGNSPRSIRRSSSHCLRKNLLSSNYSKPDSDNALESDDSMNECLLQASQVVEEVILKQDVLKKPFNDTRKHLNMRDINADVKFKMDHDSMDAILNSIHLDSPTLKKMKCESLRMNNDSFDSFVGNLNDSDLDKFTQPIKSESISSKNPSKDVKDWSVQELVVHESQSPFGRHNSMPVSPSLHTLNQPSTSGMSFGRYKSMPQGNDKPKTRVADLSPVKCSLDEIKKKHQLAKEKLMAKRVLPFTLTNKISSQTVVPSQTKNSQFKFKVPSPKAKKDVLSNVVPEKKASIDIKSIIEKKRQEALLRLRKRQPQKKIT